MQGAQKRSQECYMNRAIRLPFCHDERAAILAAQVRSRFSMVETIMANLVDKSFVERANTVLLLGILWVGLAACVLGALSYDIAYWFEGW